MDRKPVEYTVLGHAGYASNIPLWNKMIMVDSIIYHITFDVKYCSIVPLVHTIGLQVDDQLYHMYVMQDKASMFLKKRKSILIPDHLREIVISDRIAYKGLVYEDGKLYYA